MIKIEDKVKIYLKLFQHPPRRPVLNFVLTFRPNFSTGFCVGTF